MLKLIPPGKRKNKFWTIRGSLDGFKIEKSLGCSLRQDAEKKFKQYLAEYEGSKDIAETITFATAMERYIEYRKPRWTDERRLRKLSTIIGQKLLTEINLHTLVQAANELMPNNKASSKNRGVLTLAAVVLHYAADNKWCPHLRIKKFPVATPPTRYVTAEVEKKLLDATNGIKHFFILWLFRQGDRLSDVLRINYEDYDSATKTISRHVSKSDRHVVLPVDDYVCEILDAWPHKKGRLFPWNNPTTVYNWLRPLCRSLGVEFTPHRARHTLGKRLNDEGAGVKTIMQILGQSDVKSAIRYQTTDIETLRRAKQKVAR